MIDRLTINYLDDVYSLSSRRMKDSWSKEFYRDEIKNPNTFGHVLIINDVLVAFVMFLKAGDALELLNIVSIEDKKGYGGMLFNYALHDEKRPVFLEVRESNTHAIEFYKKFGFIQMGVRQKYYSNGENAIILKKT